MYTDIPSVSASGMERTTRRRVGRTWHITFEDNLLELDIGVGYGYSGKECLRIGMSRAVEYSVHVCYLYDLTEIHHGHSIAYVLDDREVVGDEEVRKPELLLEVVEKIQHLGLDGHVQS